MSYALVFLKPFLSDRLVWASLLGWALSYANTKFAVGVDKATLDGLVSALSVWALARVTHLKSNPAVAAAVDENKK